MSEFLDNLKKNIKEKWGSTSIEKASFFSNPLNIVKNPTETLIDTAVETYVKPENQWVYNKYKEYRDKPLDKKIMDFWLEVEKWTQKIEDIGTELRKRWEFFSQQNPWAFWHAVEWVTWIVWRTYWIPNAPLQAVKPAWTAVWSWETNPVFWAISASLSAGFSTINFYPVVWLTTSTFWEGLKQAWIEKEFDAAIHSFTNNVLAPLIELVPWVNKTESELLAQNALDWLRFLSWYKWWKLQYKAFNKKYTGKRNKTLDKYRRLWTFTYWSLIQSVPDLISAVWWYFFDTYNDIIKAYTWSDLLKWWAATFASWLLPIWMKDKSWIFSDTRAAEYFKIAWRQKNKLKWKTEKIEWIIDDWGTVRKNEDWKYESISKDGVIENITKEESDYGRFLLEREQATIWQIVNELQKTANKEFQKVLKTIQKNAKIKDTEKWQKEIYKAQLKYTKIIEDAYKNKSNETWVDIYKMLEEWSNRSIKLTEPYNIKKTASLRTKNRAFDTLKRSNIIDESKRNKFVQDSLPEWQKKTIKIEGWKKITWVVQQTTSWRDYLLTERAWGFFTWYAMDWRMLSFWDRASVEADMNTKLDWPIKVLPKWEEIVSPPETTKWETPTKETTTESWDTITNEPVRVKSGSRNLYQVPFKGEKTNFVRKSDAQDYINRIKKWEIKEPIISDFPLTKEQYKTFKWEIAKKEDKKKRTKNLIKKQEAEKKKREEKLKKEEKDKIKVRERMIQDDEKVNVLHEILYKLEDNPRLSDDDIFKIINNNQTLTKSSKKELIKKVKDEGSIYLWIKEATEKKKIKHFKDISPEHKAFYNQLAAIYKKWMSSDAIEIVLAAFRDVDPKNLPEVSKKFDMRKARSAAWYYSPTKKTIHMNPTTKLQDEMVTTFFHEYWHFLDYHLLDNWDRKILKNYLKKNKDKIEKYYQEKYWYSKDHAKYYTRLNNNEKHRWETEPYMEFLAEEFAHYLSHKTTQFKWIEWVLKKIYDKFKQLLTKIIHGTEQVATWKDKSMWEYAEIIPIFKKMLDIKDRWLDWVDTTFLEKWDILDYDSSQFDWLKWHLSVLTSALTHSVHPSKKIRSMLATWAGWVRSAKMWLVDNVAWALRQIVVTDANWNRTSMYEVFNWIDQQSITMRNNMVAALNIESMVQMIEVNGKKVDIAYQFVINNVSKLRKGLHNKDAKQNLENNLKNTWNDNSIFLDHLWLPWDYTKRGSVVADYVWLATQDAIIVASKEKIEKIKKENPDLTKEELEALLDTEWWLTTEEIRAIQKKVIDVLPEETREFFNQYFDKFWRYWSWPASLWYERIWSDLIWLWLIKWKIDWYTRWYIHQDRIKYYEKIQRSRWVFSKTDHKNLIEKIRKESEEWGVKPDFWIGVTKERHDVWFLHTHDPLTAALNYTKETSQLVKNKMFDDALNQVRKNNPKVWQYIEDVIHKNGSRIEKILFWSLPPKNTLMNILSWGTQFATYVWNIPLMAQNALTIGTFWLWEAWRNLVRGITSGEGWLTKEWFPFVWEGGDLKKYLYNRWLLQFEVNDKELFKFWSTKSIWVRSKAQIKKLWGDAISLFTAFGLNQTQIITAANFMDWIVGKYWWRKDWETLSTAFERVLKDKVWRDQEMKIRWELASSLQRIENTWVTAKAVWKIFDVKIFNAVKQWSRNVFSEVIADVFDIVDIAYRWTEKIIKWEKLNMSKWSIEVTAKAYNVWIKAVLPYYIAMIVADMLFDWETEADEDVRKEFLRKMVARNLQEYWAYFATNPMWIQGATMMFDRLINWVVEWVINVASAGIHDREGMLEAAYDGFRKTLIWMDKLWKAIEWDAITTDSNGWFKYRDENYPNTASRVLWLSYEAAWANKSYQDMIDKIDEINNDKWFIWSKYTKLSRTVDKYLWAFTTEWRLTLENFEATHKINKMNRRIEETRWTKMWFEAWVSNALWNDYSETAKTMFITNLSDALRNTIKSDESLVNKLEQTILPEIYDKKQIDWMPNVDFGEFLLELNEKRPAAYVDFYRRLYGSIDQDWLDTTASASKKTSIDKLIYTEQNWLILSSTTTKMLKIVMEEASSRIARDNTIPPNTYEKLKTLDETIGLFKWNEFFKAQIYDSISEMVDKDLNNKNIEYINRATKDFPEIRELYKRLAENRGAKFIDEWWEITDDTKYEPLPYKWWGEDVIWKIDLTKFIPWNYPWVDVDDEEKDPVEVDLPKMPKWKVPQFDTQPEWILLQLLQQQWAVQK